MLGVEWREVVQLLQPSVALSPTFKERFLYVYLFCFAQASFRPTVLLNTRFSAVESRSAMK